MKILLVDDSRMMRGIQKRSLESLEGVQFSEASDGADALSMIKSGGGGPFDLVIVDWNMPQMNGISFVTALREFDKRTPVLMCTTEAEKQRVMVALQAGANNYLLKPFTPEAICQKVRQLLAKAGTDSKAA